jgi:transaldolase
MIVIRELAEIFAIHEIESEVLAASIRNPLHVTQAALAAPTSRRCRSRSSSRWSTTPLTDKGIVQFKKDWEGARAAAASKEKAPA